MIDLREYFSKVFVLNLDIRPDRWEQFQERAAAAGITGFERYRAIEGDKCFEPAWWRSGTGAWGCLMSHLRVAQDALLDKLPNYLVFEDDAIFAPDFAERLPKIMEQLNTGDWDQLYLGGQHLWKEAGPPWPYRDGIVRCRNVNRTHAFAVNQRFMVKFSQHIIHAPDYIDAYTEHDHECGCPKKKPYFMHIDHQLGKLHELRQHKILAVEPWICGQAASSSNISGKSTRENWWQSTGWYE
jgi:GR25 family glycosyltransferase involved in LPS biosynthesis